MTHPHWPLLDLRLMSGDLVLAPLTEADLPEVVRVMPADVELNPRATTYDVDEQTQRAVVVHQEYWRSYGTWTSREWRFHFAVRRDGELLGLQELEGNDFPTLRTVDTSSWLVHHARGTGVGKRMRRAVLALAFGPLGARAAITSAVQDNHASLGVSRSLGYRPNGESFLATGARVETLVHMRMTRDQWEATGAGADVTIEAFEPCRPFFGLLA
ncbi:MAG: GNAT family N-acetyltransferase [Actinomycetes bacterium]